MPPPRYDFLAAQVRWAMGRGIPLQEAEDLVFEAHSRAASSHDPAKGPFEPYMQVIVRNACAYWWRTHARRQRAHEQLSEVLAMSSDGSAERNQVRILAELQDDEQAVFAAWALQKHLGKGKVTSDEMASSLGLTPAAYDNAKRRLKTRLHQLLDQLGWSVADVLYGDDDVEHTG